MHADITLIISDLCGGGAQRVLSTLANAWCKQGRRVCVITFTKPDEDFFQLDHLVQRIVIGGIGESRHILQAIWMNWKRIWRLRSALRKSGAPVTVSFAGTTNILTILAAFGLATRVVISERNDPSKQSLGRIWDFLRKKLYRYADGITANSEGVLQIMKEFVPIHKLAYVPNPLCIPSEESEAKPLSGATILAVGRLHPQKGYDILLSAFARLSPEFPEWRLQIIGEGPLRDSLRNLACKLGIDERIDWHAQVRDPFPFYRMADIFVLASRHEGMPNVLLEAMGCGLPVIVTDGSPGPLELVEHGVTGLVVPSEDIPALTEALRLMILDSHLRTMLGEAARERICLGLLPNSLAIWEEVMGLKPIKKE